MKSLTTVKLDAAAARERLDEAKEILSALRRPSGRGLSGADAQKAWFLVDQAEGYIDGLISYVSMGPTNDATTQPFKSSNR